MLATPEDVLHTWYGPPGSPPLERSWTWFQKDDAFDAELRRRFEATLTAATTGACDAWKATPRGRLALVILFDQLSRNMFRGTPRSFAQDGAALALTLEALDAGLDRELSLLERYFLLMPLMHAESVAIQRRSVAEFERLRADATPDVADVIERALDFARQHAAIVERFGRYPHRNAILGRPTTPEEAAFLEQPGSSF